MSEGEGFIDFRGHKVWYRAVGERSGGRVPLLALHGGPGVPSDYLADLAGLAEDGRQVILYDQLGCGRSDQPDDPALWMMETFIDELTTVRERLGLDRVHILGQSWGGWLLLEYALRRPQGLASMVLSNTSASTAAFVAGVLPLKAALPAEVLAVLERHEADGTTDDPGYMAAALTFYARHVCRTDPMPEHVVASFVGLSQPVYGAMWGPSEFHCTGNLRDWDVTGRLAEIDIPTLVISGRYDEMTPDAVRPLADGIRSAEWVIFEESAHLPMAEEPQRYREVVSRFLASHDV